LTYALKAYSGFFADSAIDSFSCICYNKNIKRITCLTVRRLILCRGLPSRRETAGYTKENILPSSHQTAAALEQGIQTAPGGVIELCAQAAGG